MKQMYFLSVLLAAGIGAGVGSTVSDSRAELRLAETGARLDALSHRVERQAAEPAATGTTGRSMLGAADEGEALVRSIITRVQDEMGLMPVQMVRQRRDSFVELYSTEQDGGSTYGTAGHIGGGYFLTVKHAVVALDESSGKRIDKVRLRIGDRLVRARIIDAGKAKVEVDPGDWAIVAVDGPVDLPPLRIDLSYDFPFADPLVRMGNDYSKGIIAATGYVGQRNQGLVTCLTDGHPGVSGGGVMNQRGDLVGIPVGRLQGDFRFSFILPVRAEMFRKVPAHVLAGSAS
jgi:S1-C subfamily serine protease